MANRNKQIFIYLSCFIPLIILISEASLAIYTTVAGIKLPNRHKYEIDPSKNFDLNTGSYIYKPSKKDLQNKNSFINRHGLIRTYRSTNKNSIKNVKGIAILGNSVALGYPVTHQGMFEKSFVYLLEKELIKKDQMIDIVNLSHHAYNSWQENVQLVKYLNSNNNFNDLPNIKLVASIGGIQDLWGFINFLDRYKDPLLSEFHSANGSMFLKNKREAKNINRFGKAQEGDILAGLKVFMLSILRGIIVPIQNNSYSLGYLNLVTNQKNKLSKSEPNFKNENLKLESISEVVSKKLNMSMEEYSQKKSTYIKNIVRNFKSMIAINPADEFLFIYLPTKFSFSNQQENISERYQISNLNVSDFHLLEFDYRLSLLKSLNKLENLNTFDLANKGSLDWFIDESHYTIKGHEEISKLIIPIFSEVLVK